MGFPGIRSVEQTEQKFRRIRDYFKQKQKERVSLKQVTVLYKSAY